MHDPSNTTSASPDARDEPRDVHYECRRCGMSVDAGTDRCPACNAVSISQNELV